ncbi:dTDP-glucose 4,6-dehydratase [Candidatus Woesearchaeota archaeon CG_4_10_14_0_2_um_filter_57_5]|nr:MAG: dTDP-glucose 4,6-dehydratase [Candidatus Woesearchaeota archaeon CG1_02_57_44]PIN68040.1 MAG: dTDP-glucose 4,6-dehydratase [Candidatus Woesearchaeota archaeon CG11_big_fil_rev_8_21_14_0_20_57_5]PIZ55583.1 MAG: dTDP-glucose 4,6-dehydratase [Candidatus Woesearchaeota archaeon CG_4_10_14_0_2_um_filter_57_5]
MRLLVTGGCGFIGSNFILRMLSLHDDWTIVNLDILTYAGNEENLAAVSGDPRYTFIRGDICDAAVVDALMTDCDAVVHFAAESHVDRSILAPAAFVRANVLGTQVLLDAAVRYNVRFHHISTDEVFGALGKEGTFSEQTPYAPRSPYAASKAAADHLVRAYIHTYGLKATISNCSNNYGPYQFPEKLIPLAVTNLIDGKKIPVYGKGENIRDWVHVDDHNDAVALVLTRGRIGETYCIGGDTELRNIDVARAICTAFDKGDESFTFVTDRKGHDFRYAIDFSKIQKELGWTPAHDFAAGLAETISWYRSHEKWWRKLQGRVIADVTEKE